MSGHAISENILHEQISVSLNGCKPNRGMVVAESYPLQRLMPVTQAIYS
jgi:hypothetical protein